MKITRKQLKRYILESISLEKQNQETSQPLKEPIIDRIIQILEKTGLAGKSIGNKQTHGLFKQVDNYDEFEDLIRYIVNAVGLPNEHSQIYFVLKKIATDFKKDPKKAAFRSDFNLATGK